jgi:hypothetical protein
VSEKVLEARSVLSSQKVAYLTPAHGRAFVPRNLRGPRLGVEPPYKACEDSGMGFEFLSDADANRATAVLQNLQRHGIEEWALTGGLAIETHLALRHRPTGNRSLNDLDFVVSRFDCIPESLGTEFLFRHIHPQDPPGKTIAQLVDPHHKLRVDVFRAVESLFSRTIDVEFAFGCMRVVSIEDLTARLARIVLQIGEGTAIPPKYANDLLRLLEMVDPVSAETVWSEHRGSNQPIGFANACELANQLITSYPEMLVPITYSTNAKDVCARCDPNGRFRLAGAETIISVLGYC